MNFYHVSAFTNQRKQSNLGRDVHKLSSSTAAGVGTELKCATVLLDHINHKHFMLYKEYFKFRAEGILGRFGFPCSAI